MNTAPTALVADDEEAPREQLLAALRAAWPALNVVAVAANGVDAWDAFLEHEPGVCFLDIRMPGLSGIDVARRIAGRAQVVFVSAYDDHALAAFDAGDADKAEALADEVADEGAARWQIDSILGDLQTSLDFVPDADSRERLHTVMQGLQG